MRDDHTGVELAVRVALTGRAKERPRPGLRQLEIETGARKLLEDRGRNGSRDDAKAGVRGRRSAQGCELTTRTDSII